MIAFAFKRMSTITARIHCCLHVGWNRCEKPPWESEVYCANAPNGFFGRRFVICFSSDIPPAVYIYWEGSNSTLDRRNIRIYRSSPLYSIPRQSLLRGVAFPDSPSHR